MPTTGHTAVPRPPIVAVMGHIDHGKSTLLDYIRHTNIVEGEAGGITQRLSAYEVEHQSSAGARKITFLDTPGHESFVSMRSRGASVADVAILVVSAEEGVKAQTLEAKKSIGESGIPFVVAITKTDQPGANVERAKQSILENGIYLEQLGGDVPWVAISAKSGEGVSELLDTVLLVADIAELTGDPKKPAEGFVIESDRDPKRGISATLVITDGSLKTGSFVVAGSAFSPVRILEDFQGKPVKEATFSSPVQVIGWSEMPLAGTPFTTVLKKKGAEALVLENITAGKKTPPAEQAALQEGDHALLPLVIKADAAGSIEAIEHELSKLPQERLRVKIVQSGVGPVSESDVKVALSDPQTVIVAFNVPVDAPSRDLALRSDIDIATFDVIYKLTEYLEELLQKRTPKQEVEETVGSAKILKAFSTTKDKHVLGGRVLAGGIELGAKVRVLRRDLEIGRGSVANLQQQKTDVKRVEDGEFGMEIKSKMDIAPGDTIEAFRLVER